MGQSSPVAWCVGLAQPLEAQGSAPTNKIMTISVRVFIFDTSPRFYFSDFTINRENSE
jgi:hypothetical protein